MMETNKHVVHYLLNTEDAYASKRTDVDKWTFANGHDGLYEQFGRDYSAYVVSPTQIDLTYSCLDEERTQVSFDEETRLRGVLITELRKYIAMNDYAFMGCDRGAGWVRYLAREAMVERYHIVMVFDELMDAITFKLQV